MLPRSTTALVTVVVVGIQLSQQYFYNGIKSGLEPDLKHSLFLDRIGQCRWQSDLAIFLADMRIVQRNHTHYVISGVLRIRRNITEATTASVSIEICQNTTQCRPFVDPPVSMGDVCKFLDGQRNSSLGEILSHSVPAIECPFTKGLYRINDALVDYKLFRYFSPHVSKLWRIDFVGESDRKRVFCVRIELFVYSWEDMLPRY
uniref:MD-2-related lipid-recognition domain-containing protein n=1 Tax=Anopheles culicifacies TaxID=139723 RepID=A0A182MG05_9DIPT